MTNEPSQEIANMDGAAALPRSNGELVFEAPWEGRAFGIGVELNETGHYPWRAFRDGLVKEIEANQAGGPTSSYYELWLTALEKLLLDKGVLNREELEERTAEYASGARDDDWDHDH
ncbi:MAG TPA: nitrile hydratase accessory protein [Dehalococcoidia bacterium]|nr:nitrile hydratase accessory protein [Dehalococcoidia bacterium]